MEVILKKPYEISLWEDISEGNSGSFKERLVGVIGSDTMNTPIRAINPTFSKNVNGLKTLTFSMFATYLEEESNNMLSNPFLKFLVNERKVKLKYDNKWYDFIIKDINEDSSSNTFTYTAKDAQIDELSKTGFQIELSPELYNNQGTIVDLAAQVIEGSDWKINLTGENYNSFVEENFNLKKYVASDPEVPQSEIIRQVVDEPLFKIVLGQNITVNELFTNEEIVIPEGQIIYGFYETILNQDSYFQFIYNSAYDDNNPYPTDDERIILESDKGPIYHVYKGKMSYREEEGVHYPIPIIAKENEIPEISKSYRGERYVRHQKVKLDPKIDKYVKIYKDEANNKVYCFEETEYIASDMVQNIITNGKDFMTDSGWSIEEGLIKPEMSPDPKDMPFGQVANSFLQMQFNNNQSKALNMGIRDHRAKIETIKKDEEYVFRVKYGIGQERPFPGLVEDNPKLSLKIAEYKLTDTGIILTKTYFDFKGSQLSGESEFDDDGFKYYYVSAKATDSLSLNDMVKKKIGIFLFPESSSVGLIKYWIKDIQVFPKHVINEKMVVPGVAPESLITTTQYYYNPNQDYNDINDLEFLNDNPELYEKVYNSDFVKIRSITAAESNRYNLLQSLAETFECWIKFTIKHDSDTGEILRDIDGRLEKYISFHKFVGQDNHIGFKYGINLNSINRRLASDQIVSKLIVKPNSNQFGEDGFTTIARAQNNPTKDNFLINFRHYIQQGLLDYDEVYDDLYSMDESSIGYYARLRDINTRRDELIQEQSLLIRRLLSLNGDFQAYSLIRDEAAQGIIDSKEELENYSGFRYQNFFESETNIATYRAAMKAYEDKQVRKIFTDIHSNQRIYDNYAAIVEKLEVVLEGKEDYVGIKDQIKAIDEALKEQTNEKRELDQKFYNKYSTFLKEGSWISEDYIDDNLYYLDAESVLYTSAAPQVAYTIDVLELSQLEDYKDFKFQLGDRTYVEDVEFFGWSNKHDVKTPYQEDIVISEITYNLDSPENNKIVVQNYQGEFESLFQRITAMTQAIQYQSGAYARAAKLVNPDGTLKNEVLQRSFSNNELILSNARDQSVVWDDTGITISNENRPNEIVRLVNQGILLTQDGGETWQVGITGSGINANYLNAGQIDTSEINIVSGRHVAFRWDAAGLSSYAKEAAGEETWFVTNRFIRFDQHGLYSFSGDDNFEPSSVSDILNNSGVGFALTREGFFFQSPTDATQSHYRYVTLDSNDGLVLTDYEEVGGVGSEVEKVKAGILYTNSLGESIYGLRLRDHENRIVLEQTEEGTLYLSNLLEIGPNTELASGEAYYYPRVQFGLVGDTIGEGENSYHKILNVNNLSGRSVLRMYDNGLLEAENVNLAGHIEATSGKIGGVSIGDVATTTQQAKGIKIISEKGTVLKLKGDQTSPESLLLRTELNSINPINPISGYTWEASSNFTSWSIIDPNKDGSEIELTYDELFHFFDNYGRCYIRVSITEEVDENIDKTYTDFISISTLSDGQEAQIVSLSTSNQIFVKKENEENFSPDFTMVHSRLQNIANPELLVWSYWTDDQLEENATIILDEGYSNSGISRSGSSVRVYPDIFTSRVIIKVNYKDQIEDYITILKLEDGVQGIDGQDAYNVILNNESHTFLGGLEKAKIGETVILRPIAYRGTTKLEDVIIPIDSIILDNFNDFDVSYFNGAATLKTTANTPLEGVLNIPIKITDGDTIVDDIVLTFSYAVALRGGLGVIVQDNEPDDNLVWIDTSEEYLPVITDGRGISNITEHYAISNSKSIPPLGPLDENGVEWGTNVPTASYEKRYLWNYEKINYTDGGFEYTDRRVIGMYSNSIKSIHNYYLISADGVGITNDLESIDWGERDPNPIPTPTEEKPFLWNFEEIVFEDESAPNHITEARILSKIGSDAKLLYLSASSQSVLTDREGIFTPSEQAVMIKANTQNINIDETPIHITAKGYVNENDSGTEIDLHFITKKERKLIASSGSNNMWENYRNVVVTAECGNLTDTITIVLLSDGRDGATGPQYMLELNYNSVMRHYDVNTNTYAFSPETMPISFQRYVDGAIRKLEAHEYEAKFYVLPKGQSITTSGSWTSIDFLKNRDANYIEFFNDEWRVNFLAIVENEASLDFSTEELGIFNDLKRRLKGLDEEVKEQDVNFKIEFSPIDEDTVITDYIIVKDGFPKGMTTFAVNAASVDAAVRETKLKFSADGLAIYNGGIKIYKSGIGSEELFYADASGNLHLKGYIYATGGTFKGVFTNEDNEDLEHLIGEKVSPSDLSILGRTTIHGGNITTNSIAADKINVNSLSAISANLGSISGGTLNINNRFKVSSLGYLTATGATLSGNIQAKSIVDDGGNFAQIGRVIPGQGGSGLGILVGENESGRGDQFLWSFVTDLNETSTTEYGAGLFLKNRVNPYFAAMPNQGGSLVTDGEKNRIILNRSGTTVFYDAKGDIRLYLSNLTSKDTYLQSDTYQNKIGVDNTGPYLVRGGTKRYVFVSYGTSTPTNLANGEIYVQY